MPAGRPKIEIDWDEFHKLCQLFCTLVEIAGWFNVSEDTIERRVKEKYKMNFAEYYKKACSGGKISLRRFQYQSAKNGSVPMQIWLGKQYLGQRDIPNDDIADDLSTAGWLPKHLR